MNFGKKKIMNLLWFENGSIFINGKLFVTITYVLCILAVFGFYELIDILIYLYKNRKLKTEEKL